MELDQLRHFLKVAETGNFTRAAEQVRLSQPALSRSIARLEQEIGQPLFDRQAHKRQVVLTDAGRILLPRARHILMLVDDLRAEISDDGQSGRVRVAAIPTIAPYFLPPFLQAFGKRFQKASVIVQEDTTDVLLKKLDDGETDVAILARPIEARHLEIEDLFAEELLLVMSAVHPLCKKKRIALAELESLPFVLLGEAHCLTGNILSFCNRQSLHPVSVERTSQLASVQELVSLNHGISLIPAMARNLDSSPRRVYRSLSGEKPSREIVMAWNPYRFQSRLIEAFKQELRKWASQTRSGDRRAK
jgi:LysR family transcriptional regulator, hydrogen peroxide-inducible genes activator